MSNKKVPLTYGLMLAFYILTALILLASTIAAAPAKLDPASLGFWLSGLTIWLFKMIPLLIFIPGLYKKSERTATWLSYVSMLYFIFAVLLIFTPGAFYYGWAMSASTLLLFLFSMLYTRWRKAELKAVYNSIKVPLSSNQIHNLESDHKQ